MEAPEEVAGELVVVHGDALAEEAQEVLVDEVEPEEAVAVHAAGVAEAGEDVPGSCDGEEEQSASDGLEGAPVLVVAGEGEIDDGCAEEEDERYQAFGEDGESQGGPHGVGVDVEMIERGRIRPLRGWRCGQRPLPEESFYSDLSHREIGGDSRGRRRGKERGGLRG